MALHVVLFEPEIPQNTGNIIRTCVACDAELHIIEPMGFDLYKKNVGRYATNHLEHARITTHMNLEDFYHNRTGEFYYMTRYGKKAPSEINFATRDVDIYLVFGKESTGLPYDLLKENIDACFRLPMAPEARSLNLSNCVSIVLYEARRQQNFPGMSFFEVQKGEDFLESFDL